MSRQRIDHNMARYVAQDYAKDTDNIIIRYSVANSLIKLTVANRTVIIPPNDVQFLTNTY